MFSFGPISCAQGERSLLPDTSLSESILPSPILAGREKVLALMTFLRTLKLRANIFTAVRLAPFPT